MVASTAPDSETGENWSLDSSPLASWLAVNSTASAGLPSTSAGSMKYDPFVQFYGLNFAKATPVDIMLKYTAIEQGAYDVMVVYATDGLNIRANLTVLEDDQKFRDQYYNYTSGKIANMYGFEVYEFENCPYFTKEGVKVAFKTSPSATDHQVSFCFYPKRVFRAQGSTKMYYRDAATNPDTQANEVNFRHYYVVLPKKMEALGAIYSYDGSTAQTSDAEVTPEKNWAESRKEAKSELMAKEAGAGEEPQGQDGVPGVEELEV